jgi:acyl-CoA synthetase (AMP-forming)/AMP-acid ligase II
MEQTIHRNITEHLFRFAASHPGKEAFLHPDQLTYKEFTQEIELHMAGFLRSGILPRMRILVLIKPGIALFAVTFALLRMGAIPVMIDPGMGVRRMVNALEGIEAEGFIGIPKSHLLRYIYFRKFKTIKTWIRTGHRLSKRRQGIQPKRVPPIPCPVYQSMPDETAAIFFTSGSTGTPKGVVYKNRMIEAQIDILSKRFGYHSGETDLCTFPLVSLLMLCHGISVVLADMDMMHPAKLNPAKVIANIVTYNCTHMFCSPMVLKKLSAYGIRHAVQLPSMKRVMTAGAPVAPSILKNFRKLLPLRAEIHTPYGATEALPVTDIGDSELLGLYGPSGSYLEGICVGYPLEGLLVRIISIEDEPLTTLEQARILEAEEVGEIIFCGPNVTETYWGDDLANRLAKIIDSQHQVVWHRMGDLGRVDNQGRLWYYGRKSQRIITPGRTYFTIPVEAVFNMHPLVGRSALVGIQRKGSTDIVPVICVEPVKNKKRKIYLQEELRQLATEHEITSGIKHFLFFRNFPVDPRHNAKIYREKLTSWANHKLLL